MNRSLFNLNGTNGTKSSSPATETMKTNATTQQSGRKPFVILIEEDDQYWMPRFYLTSQIDDTKHSNISATEIASPKNVPNNQNTIISFVSEDHSTTTNNTHGEPAVTLIEENPSPKDNGSWTLIMSGNTTSVENEDAILTVKVKETSPSTNNTDNYSVKLSGDIHNEIDSESHGNIPTVTGHPTKMNITQEELVCPYQSAEDGHWMMAAEQGVCLKDNENVSLESEDKTPLTLTNLTTHGSKPRHILRVRKTLRNNWIKQTMAGHQSDMCPLGSRRPGLVS